MPAFDALSSYDITDRLGEIACPTLIVQGTEDILVPVGDAYEFARHIPHAATLILEDTGHVPMFERPLTFNRALLEFLDQDVAPDQPDARAVADAAPSPRSRAPSDSVATGELGENVSHCDGLAGVLAALEPRDALGRRPMGEAVRVDRPGRRTLQPIVADR